jgi:serine/threonine protein kinase
MSPEQALGKNLDHRTDIFSLGVVLYELTTGQRPFKGTSFAEILNNIVHSHPSAIARLNYDVLPVSEWKLLPGKQHQVGPPPWHDLPTFFRSCPGCGSLAHEIDWPHQTAQYARPWKGRDGCVSAARKLGEPHTGERP